MKIVFFQVNEKVNRETVTSMQNERRNGHLIFVISPKPYYQVNYQYYRYANGYVSNDYCYVQMGCCEVMRDVQYAQEEIEDLYEKVKLYGTLILHGIRDSYAYKGKLSMKEYRLVPYAGQPVYSTSVYLKDMKYLDEMNKSLESKYSLKQEDKLLFDLYRKGVSWQDACIDVCHYFQIPSENMEIR